MTPSITTLALNILVSERISQRSIFASKIIDIVQKIEHNSQKEVEIYNGLLQAIDQCVENPGAEVRDDFYQIAVLYDLKISSNKHFTAAA